jgi:hypothetical protein
MMKKSIAAAGVLMLAGCLGACGDGSNDDAVAEPESTASDVPGTDDVEQDEQAEQGEQDDGSVDGDPEDGADEQPDDQHGEGSEPEDDGAAGDEPDADAAGVDDGSTQEVVGERRPLTYDVPASWTVADPGVITGFEEEDPDAPFGYSPKVGMSGAATYLERGGDCGLVSGKVGTNGVGEAGFDTEIAAQGTAMLWAEAAYGLGDDEPEFQLSDPEPFEANGLTGHYAVADVTPVPHECHPEKAQVRVASFDSPDGDDVYNIIIYADASGDLAPDPDELDSIISSIRPSSARRMSWPIDAGKPSGSRATAP